MVPGPRSEEWVINDPAVLLGHDGLHFIIPIFDREGHLVRSATAWTRSTAPSKTSPSTSTWA